MNARSSALPFSRRILSGRRRRRGEVRNQRLSRSGCQAQNGEPELAQVRRTEVDEEGDEEGVPQLGVACEIYRSEVGLVEDCCELRYNPWIHLAEPAEVRQCRSNVV
jgi:hypothetical protein